MTKYTEQDVEDAVVAIANGKSLRQASREWSIPRTTLHNRIAGRQPRQFAHETRQRLSRSQEDNLTKWATAQIELGLPPTHAEVKELAQRILARQGDLQPLGHHWIERFLERNPSISARSRRLSRRKVKTRGDSIDIELAEARREREELKATLKALQRSKRKKVDVDPNTTFVGFETTQRAKKAKGLKISPDKSNESDYPTDEEDCIVVN
ncbi:Hemoglobin subunit beta [Cytospora mali]|uniref:Hemoglobin subunit beta n=1 Tax=Cytospora mali TaxID=578113 RepID=A0A194UU67_CYTMA|nr:Hemoglobin subunit beta [Valsa mali var. pyri (nom. inval.)]